MPRRKLPVFKAILRINLDGSHGYQREGQSTGSRQDVGRIFWNDLLILLEPVERRLLLHVGNLRNKDCKFRQEVSRPAEAGLPDLTLHASMTVQSSVTVKYRYSEK